MTNHIEKAKSALEYASSYPVRDAKDVALVAIANALVAIAEGHEEIVRCKDCKHATVSSLGHVKYCEMFVLPDTDGFGTDPQVMLSLDFFCGYGERKS